MRLRILAMVAAVVLVTGRLYYGDPVDLPILAWWLVALLLFAVVLFVFGRGK